MLFTTKHWLQSLSFQCATLIPTQLVGISCSTNFMCIHAWYGTRTFFIGGIINYFSEDVSNLDDQLPIQMAELLMVKSLTICTLPFNVTPTHADVFALSCSNSHHCSSKRVGTHSDWFLRGHSLSFEMVLSEDISWDQKTWGHRLVSLSSVMQQFN